MRLLLCSFTLLMTACAGAPSLTTLSSSSESNGNTPGRVDFPNPLDPATCDQGAIHVETHTLDVESRSAGSNIVFLLDDSGSMSEEFTKVRNQIGSFLSQIRAATESPTRVILLFDDSTSAVRGATPSGQAQPFSSYLQAPDPLDPAKPAVQYLDYQTWSKWSDLSFFYAFAPAGFAQASLSSIPEDRPFDATGALLSAVVSSSDCSGSGQWYRPRYGEYRRQNGSAYPNFSGPGSGGSIVNEGAQTIETPACVTALNHGRAIADYLLPGKTLNVIAVSDDDLNVNFDRVHFSMSDPTMNAYPETVYAMFKSVTQPLGDVSIRYHSIVGRSWQAGVEAIGDAHLALSKFTGGSSYDITASDWSPIFNQLSGEIIYSEKNQALVCSIQTNRSIVVKFDGQVLSSEHYRIILAENKIQFLPSAFAGRSGTIQVEIRY